MWLRLYNISFAACGIFYKVSTNKFAVCIVNAPTVKFTVFGIIQSKPKQFVVGRSLRYGKRQSRPISIFSFFNLQFIVIKFCVVYLIGNRLKWWFVRLPVANLSQIIRLLIK